MTFPSQKVAWSCETAGQARRCTCVNESSGLCRSAHSNEEDEVKGKEQEVAKADSQHGTLASTGVFIGPIRGIALAQLWDVLQRLMGVVAQQP